MKDFVQRQYEFEIERRDKLTSSTSLPIGIMTVTMSGAAAIIASMKPPADCYQYAALLLIGVALTSFAFFVYHSIRFFLGFNYKYIATSEEIRDHRRNLDAYYAQYSGLGSPDEKFEDFLIETFTRCATSNSLSNDQKSFRLYKMTQWTIVALIFCVIGGAVTLAKARIAPSETPSMTLKVDIMPDNSNDNTQTPPPPPPPPPTPPPERVIRENTQPRERR